MVTKLKNFAHKLFGLYIIGGLTTLALMNTASNVFAQNAGGSQIGWFWINAENTSGIEGINAGTDQWDNILSVIKKFINYALGLLALIALVMLLWGGYKMVASGGQEDAYKEGLKILKNAAIGIAFISISWFIVTFIFYIIGLVATS